MALRASSYLNKKKERKVQVSMSEEEAQALVDKDANATKAFRAALAEALNKPK